MYILALAVSNTLSSTVQVSLFALNSSPLRLGSVTPIKAIFQPKQYANFGPIESADPLDHHFPFSYLLLSEPNCVKQSANDDYYPQS